MSAGLKPAADDKGLEAQSPDHMASPRQAGARSGKPGILTASFLIVSGPGRS